MTVRLGFLGAGFIAAHHASMLALAGLEDRLVAVHDPDVARARAFAAAHGAAVAVSEEELVGSVDAVYVCTWTSEHARLVEAAARAGRAVFCEKPLATDLLGARRMTEAVESAGVVNQVGLVLRDYPAMVWLRHLVTRPESGRAMAVVFRDDQYLPVQGLYGSTWRADRDRAGSGTLLEHSIHDMDILEHVLGPIDEVSGRTCDFHAIEGIEDVATVGLTFTSGALGTLTSVWHDVLERPSLRRLEVLCERSFLVVEGDLFGPVRWQDLGREERCLEGEALVGALDAEGLVARNPDEAFVAAVEAGQEASPSFGAALRAHELVDAAYRSAAAGATPVGVAPG